MPVYGMARNRSKIVLAGIVFTALSALELFYNVPLCPFEEPLRFGSSVQESLRQRDFDADQNSQPAEFNMIGDSDSGAVDQQRLSLRGGMRRHEPHGLSERDRILHHVTISGTRASHIHGRIHRTAAPERQDWISRTTSIGGGYAMSLAVGSPPQSFNVLVDTGSDLTWLQSMSCTQCFEQPNRGYQRHTSSTYKPLECFSATCQALGEEATCDDPEADCTYTYQYGDQSVTNGRFSTDSITMTSMNDSVVTIPNFAFGVAIENSVSFGGVDGLLGLGQGPVSFPSQLGERYGHTFSYCLLAYNNVAGTSPIVFGDSAVPQSAVTPYSTTSWPEVWEFTQYTPLQVVSNALITTFWFLNLQGFNVVGLPMHAVPKETLTIIDSGTTVSMLEPSAYKAFKRSLVTMIEYPQVPTEDTGLDLCFNTYRVPIAGIDTDPTTTTQNPDFPDIKFSFELADWVLPRENTFIPVNEERSVWCLAMIPSIVTGIQIFGNVQQANFQIVYDQMNARVGFSPAKCDSA